MKWERRTSNLGLMVVPLHALCYYVDSTWMCQHMRSPMLHGKRPECTSIAQRQNSFASYSYGQSMTSCSSSNSSPWHRKHTIAIVAIKRKFVEQLMMRLLIRPDKPTPYHTAPDTWATAKVHTYRIIHQCLDTANDCRVYVTLPVRMYKCKTSCAHHHICTSHSGRLQIIQ